MNTFIISIIHNYIKFFVLRWASGAMHKERCCQRDCLCSLLRKERRLKVKEKLIYFSVKQIFIEFITFNWANSLHLYWTIKMSDISQPDRIVIYRASEDKMFSNLHFHNLLLGYYFPYNWNVEVKQWEQWDSLLFLYQETQERNKELEGIIKKLRLDLIQYTKMETNLWHLKIENGKFYSHFY